MTCTAVRDLLLAGRLEVVAQTSHDHTHVLFNRGCDGHWKLLQNPAQITSLAPPLARASVCIMCPPGSAGVERAHTPSINRQGVSGRLAKRWEKFRKRKITNLKMSAMFAFDLAHVVFTTFELLKSQ